MDEHLHSRPGLKKLRRKLRCQQTPTERILWQRLRNRQLSGRKFKRQYSMGPYIVDFYCPAETLAIELDGEPHNAPNRQDYDAARESYLQAQGIRIVRFENGEILERLPLVLEAIAWHFSSRDERDG